MLGLLLAAPALAHGDVHAGGPGGSAGGGVPHVTLLALAVAGGLLLGPVLTGHRSAPVRRLWALRLLALTSVVGVLATDLTATRTGVALLLTAALALPATPDAAKGAFLLLVPSLLLRDIGLEGHVVTMVGHVLGAGLWAGTVAHLLTLPRLDRAAWRAGTRPAVAGIAVASLSGVVSASQIGLTLDNATDSGYGLAVLVKASVVLVLVVGVALLARRTAREGVLRAEALALAGVVVTGVALAVVTPPGGGVLLPGGLAVQADHALLVAQDGERRLLRVSPAADVRVDGRPAITTPSLDGSVSLQVPAAAAVQVAGRDVSLPAAVPLAAGPGDDAERLARTLGAVVSDRPQVESADVVAVLTGQREDLQRRRLHAPVVVVDGDPRGAAVARALGARAVPVGAGELPPGADVAYVATSWGGALAAMDLVARGPLIGGAVLLPWLVAPATLERARGAAVTALTDRDLEGADVLRYRRVLAELPGSRPSLVGLRAWAPEVAAPRVRTYAATPAGIFPAELAHGHDVSSLPAWTSAGALVRTRSEPLPAAATAGPAGGPVAPGTPGTPQASPVRR